MAAASLYFFRPGLFPPDPGAKAYLEPMLKRAFSGLFLLGLAGCKLSIWADPADHPYLLTASAIREHYQLDFRWQDSCAQTHYLGLGKKIRLLEYAYDNREEPGVNFVLAYNCLVEVLEGPQAAAETMEENIVLLQEEFQGEDLNFWPFPALAMPYDDFYGGEYFSGTAGRGSFLVIRYDRVLLSIRLNVTEVELPGFYGELLPPYWEVLLRQEGLWPG